MEMRCGKQMKTLRNQRGMTLIAAVIAILVLGMAAAMVVSLVSTDSDISLMDLQDKQATYLARTGFERAMYQFKTGTACAALGETKMVGSGSYTNTGTNYALSPVTTGPGTVNPGDTTISVNSDPIAGGYAPFGRITIGSEAIDYSGASTVPAVCAPSTQPCFTGARRGVAGTTPATHLPGSTVSQNQCLIGSTGSVTITGVSATSRVVQAAAQVSVAMASGDGAATVFGTASTPIGTFPTALPSGDNLVIAMATFDDPNTIMTVPVGALRLQKGAAVLASNQSSILFGDSPPSQNNFQQDFQVLLYKDVASAANPTYSVTAFTDPLLPASPTARAEVKLLVLGGVPNSSFQDGANQVIGATETTLLTHASTVPAGTNVILAAVHLDEAGGGQTKSIAAGNLRLKKGGVTLASNQYAIELGKSQKANAGTGFLLMYRDVAAAANPTYTVTALATLAGLNGEVKIIVFNGLTSAFLDTGSVSITAAMTTIGNLATTFPPGESVAISANQYDNGAAPDRTIAATQDELGSTLFATNEFGITLCGTGGKPECTDYNNGLLLHIPNGAANPTFLTRAQADDVGISGESKIIAIKTAGSGGSQQLAFREFYP